MQKTFVMIKPDGLERELVEKITNIYTENGLKISRFKLFVPTEELIKNHYIEHKNKPFYQELINYLTRGKIVAMEITGPDAINKVRKLNGNTDPTKAEKGTIREKYALSLTENTVHASSDTESAKKELELWFEK